MPIRVSDVIAETRRIMSDKAIGEVQRNKDTDFRGALRLVVSHIRRVRPDAFLGSGLDMTWDPMEVEELPLDSFFMSPVCMLLAGYMFMQNDEYAEQGVSANLLALGASQLGTQLTRDTAIAR